MMDLEGCGSDHGLLEGIIPAFAWREWGKQENTCLGWSVPGLRFKPKIS
jgi:hypothetical protein